MDSCIEFLDLPNEIISLIFNDPTLPTESLIFLAILNRRLHYLSLPIYFNRQGIQNPSHVSRFTLREDTLDPLSALQTALFISEISEIVCTFPSSTDTVFPLLTHLRRLKNLISRLTAVETVTLVLDDAESSRGAAERDADLQQKWSLVFGSLLEVILEKGCTSLQLQYGRFFTEAYDTYSVPTLTRITRPLSALKKAVRQTLASSDQSTILDGSSGIVECVKQMAVMELSSDARSRSALQHFFVESPILFHPPCVNSFLSILRYSPIARLYLSGIALPTAVWSAMLPHVATAVPTLSELSLSNLVGISGEIILKLCCRMPLLTKLTIGYTEYSKNVQSSCPDSGPVPKFPHMTTLSAPSIFISHFLKPKSALPKLQSLCVSPRRLILGYRSIRYVGRAIYSILRRLQKCHLSPSLSLHVHLGAQPTAELVEDLTNSANMDEDVFKSLRAITNLIVTFVVMVPYDELDTLVRWIALFPSVSHVSLQMAKEKQEFDIDASSFIRAISLGTTKIRTVELCGRRFDVDEVQEM